MHSKLTIRRPTIEGLAPDSILFDLFTETDDYESRVEAMRRVMVLIDEDKSIHPAREWRRIEERPDA